MNLNIISTLSTLENYKFQEKNRETNQQLLCVKKENGQTFLSTIDRGKINCWTLFQRFFGFGILKDTQISIKSIHNHMVNVVNSEDFSGLDIASNAYKTAQRIAKIAKNKGDEAFFNDFLHCARMQLKSGDHGRPFKVHQFASHENKIDTLTLTFSDVRKLFHKKIDSDIKGKEKAFYKLGDEYQRLSKQTYFLPEREDDQDINEDNLRSTKFVVWNIEKTALQVPVNYVQNSLKIERARILGKMA